LTARRLPRSAGARPDGTSAAPAGAVPRPARAALIRSARSSADARRAATPTCLLTRASANSKISALSRARWFAG
jgi:hypothetical protein